MLTYFSTALKGDITADLAAASLPPGVNWIDLLQPNPEEIAFARKVLGIDVPSAESLDAIETSRRLYRRGDVLFMSLPMIVRPPEGMATLSSIGFVLTGDFVLTARYGAMKACDNLRDWDVFDGGRPPDGPNALIQIVEAIIDDCSDELERISGNLDHLSRTVFDLGAKADRKGPSKTSADLREVLGSISGSGYMDSKIDDVLLGLARMLPFVLAEAKATLTSEDKAKLKSLARDVSSLQDYGRVQSERIQFMLDATLGLTNIDQNNIFRVLTVVSVIGIPPTLVASMYGMNFKNMPELDWHYGYAWGLSLILISALIPIVWFKRRGWW